MNHYRIGVRTRATTQDSAAAAVTTGAMNENGRAGRQLTD